MRNSTKGFCLSRRLFVLLIAYLAVFASFHVIEPGKDGVVAQTVVNGNITQNATWDLAGSPYLVGSRIAIEANATLTIEAGVVVKVDSFCSISIYGELIAKGNETAQIVITANSTDPNEDWWSGIEVEEEGRVVMDFVEISRASFFYIYGSGSSITNSTLTEGGAISLFGSSTLVYNNKIISNGVGINGIGTNDTIERNVIVGNHVGIHTNLSKNLTIRNNHISVNDYSGILIDSHSGLLITCNNISWNGGGIALGLTLASSHIYHNNIYTKGTHAADWRGLNYWDNGSEGNYWSNYSGSDPDGNGIGNEPYIIDEDSQDNYPLMNPLTHCDIPDVNLPPVSIPRVDKTIADELEDFEFNGNESFDPDGTLTNYTWTFGDGTKGYGVVVRHNYSNIGFYYVYLTVVDDEGMIDEEYIIVQVKDMDNQPPVAVAKPDYQEAKTGEVVNFTGNLSYDTDGQIVRYHWFFGDGYVGTGVEVNHTYSKAKVCDVFLTVYDDDGDYDRVVVVVKITETPQPPENKPPVAVALPGFQTINVGETAWLYGNSSYDPDGWIVSYHWDFGDGTESWEMDVGHVYNQPGNYTVVLTVMDNNNTTDSDWCGVYVYGPDPPGLRGAELSGAAGQDVAITWTLSSDDGWGSISNYAVYYSSTYDGDGNGYRFLAEIPAGQSSYVHLNAGDGDWNNYFYIVRANDTQGYSSWKGQAGKFVRHMEEGMRTLSIPLVQAGSDVGSVLQTLEGSYEYVRHYDSADQTDCWKSYWSLKPYRDLLGIDHSMGLWIKMTKADDLVVAGLVPESTAISLNQGWNFVSYPSLTERQVGDVFSTLEYKAVQGYSDSPPYYLENKIEVSAMRPGEGYWVWVDSPQMWIVGNL